MVRDHSYCARSPHVNGLARPVPAGRHDHTWTAATLSRLGPCNDSDGRILDVRRSCRDGYLDGKRDRFGVSLNHLASVVLKD